MHAALAGLSVVWTLLTTVQIDRPAAATWTAIALVGAVVAVGSWIRARRTGTLLTFVVEEPERPLAVLDRTDRRELRQQMRSPDTVTARWAPVIDGMVRWQRRSSRASALLLSGMLLSLVGLAGSTTATNGPLGWWLLAFSLAVAAFIVSAVAFEVRRNRRLLEATRRHMTD